MFTYGFLNYPLFLGTKSKETQPPIVIEEEKWKKCPFTIWDRNPRFPPLSDALGITYNESGGRHIVAKRNIIAGEPLGIRKYAYKK